jgi:hypothetical protein
MENSSSHNLFRVDDIMIKEDMPTKALSNNLPKIAVIGGSAGRCLGSIFRSVIFHGKSFFMVKP